MAKRYTDEFRRDAVRMATTSGLTRPQLSPDLGDEPLRVYRRLKHCKGEPYDEEKTYPRLFGRAA